MIIKGWKYLKMQRNSSNLSNAILIKSSGGVTNFFVGVKVFNNVVEVHYPETFDLETTDILEKRNRILSLLNAISYAKEWYKEDDYSMLSAENDSAKALISYLWIINDYLHNGVYRTRERDISRSGKGKIVWKKTLRDFPIVSDGNIIYYSLITESKESLEDTITEIYKFCCEVAFRNIGWLYNLSFSDYSRLSFNKVQFLEILNSTLHKTFDDKKKALILNLIRIVNGLSNGYEKDDSYIFGIDNFEYVFERMVNEMFSNIDDISKFNPTGKWQLIGFDKAIKTSNLRPDTIMVRDNSVFIIDSKYYRYGYSKNPKHLPNTTSIQKQITYGEFIRSTYKFDKVYNIFILPYNSKLNTFGFTKDIVYFGKGTGDWKDEYDKDHVVYGVFIDLTFLVNKYSVISNEFAENLAKIIEQYE